MFTRIYFTRQRAFAMCAILFRYATHPVETGRERRNPDGFVLNQ